MVVAFLKPRRHKYIGKELEKTFLHLNIDRRMITYGYYFLLVDIACGNQAQVRRWLHLQTAVQSTRSQCTELNILEDQMFPTHLHLSSCSNLSLTSCQAENHDYCILCCSTEIQDTYRSCADYIASAFPAHSSSLTKPSYIYFPTTLCSLTICLKP